jgi:myo-inositol-1(or 4)-monophosphatase
MLRVAFDCIRVCAKHVMSQYDRTDRHAIQTPIAERVRDMLIEQLAERYPYLHFITSHNDALSITLADSEWLCCIDPLDGLENYLHGIPTFSISLALARMSGRTQQHELELAIIYDPVHDYFYHAQKGHGAFLNQKRLRIQTPRSPQKSRYATPLALLDLTPAKNIQLLQDVSLPLSTRELACPTLASALVAHGNADGFISDGLHAVNLSPGTLIILEAGGMITSLQGTPYDWKDPGLCVLGHAAFCGWLEHLWKPTESA